MCLHSLRETKSEYDKLKIEFSNLKNKYDIRFNTGFCIKCDEFRTIDECVRGRICYNCSNICYKQTNFSACNLCVRILCQSYLLEHMQE